VAAIRNPILPGFNPDPSIVRAGDDYYIATSTFEWFPGVQIHHSRDLVHWRLLTRPLDRVSQLDMPGEQASCGIWAPCLSYHDGLFWLIYTDVKSRTGTFKDTPNYLVTAPDIMGPWSEPIYLNSSGFDPSLFHDDDGRKWLVNMAWDHRKGRNRFAGILLQEYSQTQRRLVGPIRNIFRGTPLGATEGPHLYRRLGWYYLMVAEGGTGYKHAVTMARSQRLEGPYEVDPGNPVVTCADDENVTLPLQKAGHASIVETRTGEWYLVHLCGRPIMPQKRCTLGRETAIQKVRWTADGWLRLAHEGHHPQLAVTPPALAPHPFPPQGVRDDFDSRTLNIHFQTLRAPVDESWASLADRPGWLRLRGRESLASRFRQSLIARRWQAFRFEAATCVEFEPEDFQQLAGLICLYDPINWYYLRISRDEDLGKCLGILTSDNNRYDEPLLKEVSIEGWRQCHLRVSVDREKLQFSYSADGAEWTDIGPMLDATRLSDEYCQEGCFTGAFVGLCAQDLSGRRKHADFDYFEYREVSEPEHRMNGI
jgi:xylan 1,4-beta-xylosidase